MAVTNDDANNEKNETSSEVSGVGKSQTADLETSAADSDRSDSLDSDDSARNANSPMEANSNKNEAPQKPNGLPTPPPYHIQNPEPNHHSRAYWDQEVNQQTQMPNEVPVPPGKAQVTIGGTTVNVTSDELIQLQKAKKMSTAALIMAPISIFIGGVLLSTISLICSIIGFRRFVNLANAHADEPEINKVLRKAGILPMVASALTLILNIAAVVIMWPIIMQEATSSTGMVSSLLGSQGSARSTGSGAGVSTWG